jgi:hypothetical protein
MKNIRIPMDPTSTLFIYTYLSLPPLIPCFFLVLLILVTPLFKLKTFTMDEMTHIMLVSFISLMASYFM